VKLDRTILQELTVHIELDAYLRIIPCVHRATPLGTAYGSSRFSSPDDSFTLLYAARDLPTALAERIIRDRFQGRQQRVIARDELTHFAAAAISTMKPLRLVDLRGSGASQLGIPTDAVRGRAHQAGKRFSQSLFDKTDLDGIVYMSRLTNTECVAVYDRAIDKRLNPSCPVEDLMRLAGLVPALSSLSVTIAV